MDHEYSFLFHQMSKDPTGGGSYSMSLVDWPKEWNRVHYKAYPRLPRLMLSKNSVPINQLNAVALRKSTRSFIKSPVVTFSEVSTLLEYAGGISRAVPDRTGSNQNLKKAFRTYPSAGALFPIETYVLVRHKSEGLQPGLYHYNVKMHALELLLEKSFSRDDLKKYFLDGWETEAGIFIFMTAVFARSQSKYGERGYRHILLEAGHIGQNFYLISGMLGLGCCASGGTNDGAIETLLDIDGVTESIVYTLVIGRKEEKEKGGNVV